MGIETSIRDLISLRIGELRVRDVLQAVGAEAATQSFRAIVLGRDGQALASADVTLGFGNASRGRHRMLLCPCCDSTVRILYNNGRGGLGCRCCAGHRTLRQQQRGRLDFKQLGGKETDCLVKLLAKGGCGRRRRRARRLANTLVRADRDRVASVVEEADAVLRVVATVGGAQG